MILGRADRGRPPRERGLELSRSLFGRLIVWFHYCNLP